MTKHTPGPWAISLSFPNRVNDRSGIFVADTAHTWRDEGEAHANARLIAAAPDMLAALDVGLSALRAAFANVDSCDIPDYADEAEAAMHAAIAKARGE